VKAELNGYNQPSACDKGIAQASKLRQVSMSDDISLQAWILLRLVWHCAAARSRRATFPLFNSFPNLVFVNIFKPKLSYVL
jgi:hypothetical protein